MSLPTQGSVRGLALQDGKILVATGGALWRLRANGAPDRSFGERGRMDLPAGYSVIGTHPLTATRSRAYVLLGTNDEPRPLLFVFFADGRFNGSSTPVYLDGPDLQAIALHEGFVYAVGVQPDDASAPNSFPTRVMVVRFGTSPRVLFDENYNGGTGRSLGPAIVYDKYGVVTSYEPRDIAIDSATGRIYVVGEKYDCSQDDCSSYTYGFATRLKVSGGVDTTFGTGGETVAVCSNVDGAYAVALSGAKTVAGGTSNDKWGDNKDRFSLSAVSGFQSFRSQACYPSSNMTLGAKIEDLAFNGDKVIAVGGRYTAKYRTT